MIGNLIGAGLFIAGLSFIAVGMLVSDKKKHSLAEDDGIVWNTAIEKRMEQESK